MNVHYNGRLIATGVINSSGTGVEFTAVVTDRVGSVRMHGSQTMNYYPYGQERVVTGNDKNKFGTYWRDSLTGLDYAQQRYYQSGIGRFLSPDPYRASGGPANPNSWNRYTYVGGDPVNSYDPLGLMSLPAGTSPPTNLVRLADDPGRYVAQHSMAEMGDENEEPPTFCNINPFAPGCTPPPGLPSPLYEDCEIYGRTRGIPQVGDVAQHAYLKVRIGISTYIFEGGPEKDNYLTWFTINVPVSGFRTLPIRIPVLDWGLVVPRDYRQHISEGDSGFFELWGILDVCDKARQIKRRYDEYRPKFSYFPTGPNSNSFANYLLQAAGFFLPQPPGAIGWSSFVQ